MKKNSALISYILALIFCYILQFSSAYLLIAIGYYSNNIYTTGGFLVYILLFAWLSNFVSSGINKDKEGLAANKLNILNNIRENNIYRIFVLLLLAGGYLQNNYFVGIQYNYEYDNYGITTKAVLSKKEASKGGNASMTYYLTFSVNADNQIIERKYTTINKKYNALNIGDTCLLKYSPRKRYFTEILSQ